MTIRPKLRCLLCDQVIASEESRIPFDEQIKALDWRTDFTNPCLACGQQVPFADADSESYQARVRAWVHWLRELKVVKERQWRDMEETREWPPETKSLVGEPWAGQCPLDGSEMCLNLKDLYECPSCRLQIQVVSGGPNIMRLKGMGQFRLRGRERILARETLKGRGWLIEHDWRV